METTDQQLLLALSQGDRRAFQTLVGRWSPHVMDLAGRLLQDRDQARDVHQQTFLRLWAKAASFEGRARFSTWLHQVVVNLCRDARRRRRTYEQATGRLAAMRPRPALERPEASLMRAETAERVASAVADLPEDEREVVMLKHYGELTFRGVSEVLGIPVTTAKSRFGRGLDRLRSALKESL